jgi:DNA-directed RNA polymerase specialized sigma24 family protein
MVWRDSFPPASEQALDAETERERRLAAQARAGADWALTALIARYQPAVNRYLTRLCGDHDRARELAERVFERMERRLHGPHGADNLRLWLLRASTEAGLETLRHPRPGQRPPRLDAARVAGLLPPVPGAEPQQASRGGISRLRNVVGSVNRQARPLAWRASDANPRATTSQSEAAREATDPKRVGESPETLDPREALRHRLVRMTLAELTYGDAQCLALHLVAGLNQAEVARALGITGSAARKRIVHGLAQFSQRYQVAVESLGLPEELGYGDALPRRIEEEGPVPIAEPEPVIVPETPEEMVAEMLEPAPATTPLVVDSFDDEGERVSGVAYYEGAMSGERPSYPESRSASSYRGSDGEAQLDPSHVAHTGFDADAAAPTNSVNTPLYAASRRTPPIDIEIEDGPETPPASMRSEDTEATDTDEPVAPHARAGVVTRIAADAIVGPVVDALPVHSEPLAMSPGLGSPGPRSTPLVYELASGDAETGETGAGGITMNWIDSAGMMAPLSFEAIIASTPAGAEEDGDMWARSLELELVAPNEPEAASAPAAADDATEMDAPPAGLVGEPLDVSPPLDLSIALTEGDYGWTSWEPSRQGMAISEPSGDSLDSLAYEMRIPAGQTPGIFGAQPSFDDVPDNVGAQPRPAPPSTQTLEDLWDEAPDAHGR